MSEEGKNIRILSRDFSTYEFEIDVMETEGKKKKPRASSLEEMPLQSAQPRCSASRSSQEARFDGRLSKHARSKQSLLPLSSNHEAKRASRAGE
mmetsp:Transcript_12405/g.21254  ORF Transcript_12405/g.21254 Transcript_12405/m.21254 type:complete len:94 (+) Transcript_12405:2272-2553(+)